MPRVKQSNKLEVSYEEQEEKSRIPQATVGKMIPGLILESPETKIVNDDSLPTTVNLNQ
ncbi:UNKNOWN [Stylonychia lemnae]|uniref:Uncharacterized protein n=1 Tax=Stylonychia lemnae TaxID=5949 RepID=A0A078A271_STYLE|nr:UNKNOWN [Stylonychia lemnae]|eukprot:CDW76235.1 UNKNOWN [Stylonychia lemnae]